MKNKPDSKEGATAELIDQIVSRVMSSGMVISFVFYAIGLILLFLNKETIPQTSQQYYHSLSEFFQNLGAGEAGPFLYLGTASLILTPFILVLAAIITFIRERDRRFAIIAGIVLSIMIISVLIGSVFKIRIG